MYNFIAAVFAALILFIGAPRVNSFVTGGNVLAR